MLQQTQVPRVVTKWTSWITRFPTVTDTARASVKDILDEWKGLGYNRRGLALHSLCNVITDDYNEEFPKDYNELITLPGIGPYTANAIRAFAWNEPVVLIETNVRSVFIHHFFHDSTTVHDKEILPIIEETLDLKNPRDWYYALMDYGSWLKKTQNPSRKSAHFAKQSSFKGSNREQRSFILDLIRSTSPHRISAPSIKKALRRHLAERLVPTSTEYRHFQNFKKNISDLEHEGFIERFRPIPDSGNTFYRIKE